MMSNIRKIESSKLKQSRQSVFPRFVEKDVDAEEHDIKYWKRIFTQRKEPNFQHNKRNFWPKRYHYYLFGILLGNGLDGIPMMFRLSLDISGGFFILLLPLLTFFFNLPIMYMQIFLGKYTRMTNSQMYRMAPIFFGVCVLFFVINSLYAPLHATDVHISLIAALRLIINRSYLEKCPKGAVGCFQGKEYNFASNPNCTYKYMSIVCGNGTTYRYVPAYFYWNDFRNYESGYALWQSMTSNLATWIFITISVLMGMRILGCLLRVTFIINMIIYAIIFIMAVTSKGAVLGLNNLIEFRLTNFEYTDMILAAFYMSLRMGIITPNGYMSYAAYSNPRDKRGPGTECLIISMSNIILSILYLIVIHAVGGVVATYMNATLDQIYVPYSGMYFCIIPEFFTFRKSPVVLVITYHLSNWLLEIVKLGIIVHMHVLNLLDFFPKVASSQIYITLLVCGISAALSIIFTLKIFTIILYPLYIFCQMTTIQSFKLILISVLVFYCYGVSRLNDDIHFVTGKRPIKYWRILWYIYSVVMIIITGFVLLGELRYTHWLQTPIKKDLSPSIIITTAYASLVIMGGFVGIIFVSTFFFIVIGIRSSTSMMNLLKPQFHWGPPNREQRIARKAFAPRTSIRSQPPKKKRQRFRPRSIKQMHERDLSEHVKKGRIFLDSMFFTNVGQVDTIQSKSFAVHSRIRYSTL